MMKYYIVKTLDGSVIAKQQLSYEDLLNMKIALKPSAKSYADVGMKKDARQIMRTFDKLRQFLRLKINTFKIIKEYPNGIKL